MNKIKRKLTTLNIIECLVISFITGWVLHCLCTNIPSKISRLNSVTQHSLVYTIAGILSFGIATMILYVFYASYARIVMFLSTMIFSITCAYNSSKIDFALSYNNADGKIYFSVFMCFLSILAFMYVKEDIYDLIEKYHLSDIKMMSITAIFGILLALFISLLGAYRYMSFSNSTFDFGIFTQMYESMATDFTPVTTLERNQVLSHFAVHFSPIYYIALPIYLLFRHPITVNVIQAIMLALPVVPLVMIGRKFEFSNKLIFASILLYTLYPATACGAEYDMHENCFLLFMILFTIYGIETRNHLVLIIFMLLTMMVKEDAPIYILVLGLYLIVSNRGKLRGIFMMICGAFYFGIVSFFMKSMGLGIMDNRFKNLYYDHDGSLFQILRTVLTNPAYVISQFVHDAPNSVSKISYLLLMLTPVFLILITTRKQYSRFLLLIPFVLINLIPTYSYMHNICFQYNFGPMALIFYILLLNMRDMKPNDYPKLKNYLCIGILCNLILFSSFVFPYFVRYYEKYHNNSEIYQEIEQSIKNLDSAASVSASGFLTPHLYRHKIVYDQTHTNLSESRFTRYLVVDIHTANEEKQFSSLLQSGRYHLIDSVEGWIQIYELNES